MFAFASPRRSRRPSLTPMIDVVFLLLVFFMLASQFGQDAAVRLSGAGAGAAYSGPPRLIDIAPDALTLNGMGVDIAGLPDALTPLTQDRADTVILRGTDGASLQRLLDVAQALQAAGFANLVVVE
ncbi:MULTISPECIES: biopolymer transporter ExbD [unclassified Sulfitobacter]|jgi:biopolymer transport protein ExbD|uniref:ExbD/TolR family protein n=1 Tax=unclassified Sulfitobacter TaxID=196795 RepID=UPI001594C229|nr:biopolymer transporter ExbD [Sulfitobacter sp. HGT1]MBQ0805122.1 biopolymer transporter ExbD [Sulfitobacter sp.]